MTASDALRRAVRPRPASVRADAPGRVNLIGEHTDYNGGFVLPVAIPQRTRVELGGARGSRQVRVWSASVARQRARARYRARRARRSPARLGRLRAGRDRGAAPARASARAASSCAIESDVPLGGGAVVERGAGDRAPAGPARGVRGWSSTTCAWPALGQRAENEFVGAPVGIMDQMASSLADDRHARCSSTRAPSPTSGCRCRPDASWW